MISFKEYITESKKITWKEPDFNYETSEYFDNKYTNKAFKKRGLVFKTKKELINYMKEHGKLILIDRDMLLRHSENLTLDKRYFNMELKIPEYAESYKDMESKIEKGVSLPAPILFKFDNTYYGFAGNRRVNLAFRNNLPLKVWLVTV